MGQKVNPIAFRMGVTEGWRSRWYAGKKNYGDWLVEDHKIRKFVRKEYAFAGIARIDIERIGEKIRISLWAARPGLIIGKRGAKVDKMSEDVGGLVGRTVEVDVKELETPELNSVIVAEAIAEQLQKRSPYRRTMRRYAEMVMDLGREGDQDAGQGPPGRRGNRAAGAAGAGPHPSEHAAGRHRLRDRDRDPEQGTIGVKVWVYKGEKFEEKKKRPPRRRRPAVTREKLPC
jgi:small subunit ribosomal protein S3